MRQFGGMQTSTLPSPLLVTGGAGFIGSNFVLDHLASEDAAPVVNLDALTYAANPRNLDGLAGDARHTFVHGDILDRALLDRLFATHRPTAVVHFAAESHVDRSIHGPAAFLKTNIDGTFAMLEAARAFFNTLSGEEKPSSGFCMSRPTRFTERFRRRTQRSTRTRRLRRTVRTRRRKRARTTWCEPGSIRMVCRR